jgi:hypothetical protein
MGCMDRIDLAENRDQRRALVNTVLNLRVPQNPRKFLSDCTIGVCSVRAQLHEFLSYIFLSIDSSRNQCRSVISW